MDLGKLSELAERRVCKECGAEFKTKMVDGQQVKALAQFADHLIMHQPTPEQWKTAYEKIQSLKERKGG